MVEEFICRESEKAEADDQIGGIGTNTLLILY
jgi:hypothetical protein